MEIWLTVIIYFLLRVINVSECTSIKHVKDERGVELQHFRLKRGITKMVTQETRTMYQTRPPVQDDSWKRLQLTPLEIATVVALCVLVVGAFMYCIYQYIRYCCRNRKSNLKRMRVQEAEERVSSPRSWEEVKNDNNRWEDRRGSTVSSVPSSRSGSTAGLWDTGGNNKWAYC